MSKIDFSKAPEGATHYDGKSTSETFWYKFSDGHWFFTWGNCSAWYLDESELRGAALVEIKQQLTVTCNNERELMLCEQVIRMCRGEASQQQNVNNEWVSVGWDRIDINKQYRAKPKKELVVPWEFIDDDITTIVVDHPTLIGGYSSDDSRAGVKITGLKLDLTDIELPVTVERPTC